MSTLNNNEDAMIRRIIQELTAYDFALICLAGWAIVLSWVWSS